MFDCLFDCLTVLLFDWLFDCLSDCLIVWLLDCLIACLFDCLIVWLLDCLCQSIMFHVSFLLLLFPCVAILFVGQAEWSLLIYFEHIATWPCALGSTPGFLSCHLARTIPLKHSAAFMPELRTISQVLLRSEVRFDCSLTRLAPRTRILILPWFVMSTSSSRHAFHSSARVSEVCVALKHLSIVPWEEPNPPSSWT